MKLELDLIDAGMDNETTEAHFKYFQKEVTYWLNRFSLGFWGVTFVHNNDESTTLAWCQPQSEDHITNIGLSKNWKKTIPTNKMLSNMAFHEVCELLLWPLHDMASDLYAVIVVNRERHRIIKQLETAFWKPYWDKQH